MNLVYGVLRHQQYLDVIIKKLSRHPVKKMHPFVHCALLTGLYQLLFLDRIPESAAVNETVNAVKSGGVPKRLHGFVNGILRQAIRSRKNLPPLDSDGKKSVLNHPDWLTQRWTKRFGAQKTETICKVNNREPQLTLRVNPNRITRDELCTLMEQGSIHAVPGPYSPDSLILPHYQGSVAALPGYSEGYFQPQDEAAQLATLLLGPFVEKGVYLDGCAGLGGKTSHMVELTSNIAGQVIAVEPEPQRQRLFEDNISRLCGDTPPTLHRTKLQDYCRTSRQLFTGVFIDAPCSGTGVTGRHPDIRWNRKEEDFLTYQRQQVEILNHAAELVTPGGVLVYATCSLEQEENQDVVDIFLRDHAEFKLSDCAPFLPESAHKFITDGCFFPKPQEDIDGFFAVRFIRRTG